MKMFPLPDRLIPIHGVHFLPVARLIALLLPMLDLAEADAQITDQAGVEKPAINFQVLKRREVVVGDHTVTLQLVVPPVLPRPPAPAPARVLSAEELATQQRREAKQQSVLFFSATVFDRRVTELSCLGEDGKKYRAFSSLDFQYFLGLHELETSDAVCTLLMAFEKGTADELAARIQELPQLTQLPQDRAAWLLVEGSAAEGAATVAAWDAIHRHFDAHQAEVIRASEVRAAARAEKERLERENPPAPKKRVISFWKKNPAPRPSENTGGQP